MRAAGRIGNNRKIYMSRAPAVPLLRCKQGARLDGPAHGRHMQAMNRIKSICVYCGSGPGTNPAFMEAARRFGRILAENRIGLVYGGGSAGLMGACAEAVLDHGGLVTGIIPEFLTDREHMLMRAQKRIITRDLHERKQLMFEHADAFVALPGGVGTLEELVEQLTWAQLGRHGKPILIANIDHFWDPLRALIDHMEKMQFIRAGLTVNLLVAERIEDVLPKLIAAAAQAPDEELKAAAIEQM
jgi:uncharacterized protein (TIGR00730 family)